MKKKIDVYFNNIQETCASFISKAKDKFISNLFPFFAQNNDWTSLLKDLNESLRNLNSPDNDGEELQLRDEFKDLYLKYDEKKKNYGNVITNEELVSILNENKESKVLRQLKENLNQLKSYFLSTMIQPTIPPIQNNCSLSRFVQTNTLQTKRDVSTHATAILEDDNLIIISDRSGVIHAWDDTFGKKLASLNIHSKQVTCMKYSPSRKFLVTSSYDYFIKVTRINRAGQFSKVKVLAKLGNEVMGLLVIEELRLIIATNWGYNIHIWDLDSLNAQGCIETKTRSNAGTEIAYLPEKKLIAVGYYSGEVVLYNLLKKTEVSRISVAPAGYLNSLIYMPVYQLVVARAGEGKLKSFKIDEGGQASFYKEYEVSGKNVTSYNIKGNGNLFVTAETKTLRMLNPITGEIVEKKDIDLENSTAVNINYKKKKIIVGSSSVNQVLVFDF
jgi:WD40 repeat protein